MHTTIRLGHAGLLTMLAVCLLAGTARAQKIDVNANGMSDVWENIFNTAVLNPAGDDDGDGVSNLAESMAGTDPFDPNSVPRVALSSFSATDLTLSMPCALGKRYEWQSIQGLGSNWVTESSSVARTGTVVSLTAPFSEVPKFFRLVISDVDTDGDGLNDWEEYKLGLDPLTPASNGQLDDLGQPLGDYAYAASKLASQNIMTVTAIDPVATQPEPGQSPLNSGVLSINRGGFPLNAITVNLGLATPGPGVAVPGLDHAGLPTSVTLPAGVSSQTIDVTPLANTNRLSPVVATLNVLTGTGYTVGAANSAGIVIYPSVTPAGTGLTGQYYTNSNVTYGNSANFNPANLKMTRIDTNVNFTWGNTTVPIANNGYYCVRWTGQVQPQYSETYFFVVNSDDGLKLWVNDQPVIDNWIARSAADSVGSITLQGGLRYNIKLEYLQLTGGASVKLYWYSASQSKQIIPKERLYPTAISPSAITEDLTSVAFLGQPYSNLVTGANSPLGFSASPLPPGLGFNTTNGLLSGIPTLAGEYQITLTASNALGVGSSVLHLTVLDTGSSVTREIWNGVPGANVADIPIDVPASLTNFLGALEGVTDYGDNYGERIRGYLTAPVTGNYYFWLAASDSAQLWIANDGEPANKVLRASVSPGGTAPRQWNLQPKQRSPWLSLVAGQRYYIEILHKAGIGSGDNWSVGWLQDPTGTNTPAVATIVPGYVLGRHFDKPPNYIPGTLYNANMLAQGAVTVSSGVGTATLRLSADETKAVLNFHYSGLSSLRTGAHVHSDPYLNNPSQIIFDIDSATPQPDGSYVWDIAAVGTLSAPAVVEIIKEGKSYINIHTINYPSGEIRGNFTLASGAQSFTPPPPPQSWVDDHSNSNAASRFLIQATFGPSPNEIAAVQSLGYEGWISNQFLTPASMHLPGLLGRRNSDPTLPYPGTAVFNTWWERAVTAPDQLRQRVAFALSEIMVVSEAGVLGDNGRALSSYYDTLLTNAFGNFRELIDAVTLTPAMGLYLDMRGNDKGDIASGRHPNENYAREIMQLFSVGLYRMWPDGTLVLDSAGELVPTYDQNVIMGMAAVFTGWNYYQPNQGNGRLPTNFGPPSNYTNPMVLVPTHHDLGTKLLLDNVVLPKAWGTQADSSNTNFDTYCSQDLELALDNIFYNQNVGPFICRQLIQRLVTSHPSRDYLYRVVQTFNDNGSGVRGDMQAVIKAILLDYEARSTAMLTQPSYGKQREPLMRVTGPARAFPSPAVVNGTYNETGDRPITITTPTAHRLNNAETVVLTFTDTSGNTPPMSQAYSVSTTPSTNTFVINAPGLSTGTYSQTPNVTISNMVTTNIVTTNVITVAISGHGLLPGNPVYLVFLTGGASSGLYQVISTTNANSFSVVTADPTTRPSSSCLIPKITGGGWTQSGTTINVSTPVTHGLNPGDTVYINFAVNTGGTDGTYSVVTVPDTTHFTITAPNSANNTQNGQILYPLVAPQLTRSGNVTIKWSTWNVGYTDTGSSSSLSQTPLHSGTVFNFFFPDFKFPGPLASAGLTTPEFQLTSDTEVMFQMNFLYNGVLNNGNNTNGVCSFSSGDGDIVLDLGPWMTPAYTANSGTTNLVNSLSSLLLAGQLSPAARDKITGYVNANFVYSVPPTYTQMRDRVKAAVHLLLMSPDFTVQK
jgi:hypothetical protein